MKRMILCVVLLAAIAAAAAPVRILVAYHSQTGNTEKLAQAVRDGAAAVQGVEVTLRKISEAAPEDIAKADGLLIGTPVHWGNLSWEAKRFVDRAGEALAKGGKNWGEGRTAGVFCTGGGGGNGTEMARLSLISALLGMRFIIVGGVGAEGFGTLGAQAITGGKPPGVSAKELVEARQFGERFARFTLQFRAGAGR